MNILYITKLNGKPWIGPSYSIPKQIEAQSKYDRVCWFNIYNNDSPEGVANVSTWRKLPYYHENTDYKLISDLPAPFCKPDLIVVEQCYPFAKDKIRREISNLHVPYIIIPRGEFTEQAQRKKRLKKKLGNIILQVPQFVRNAQAIQCLTEQENLETGESWGDRRVVLPNGTKVPDVFPTKENNDEIKLISIGRYEPYQKGLDLLLDAIKNCSDLIRKQHIKVELYGSDAEGKKQGLESIVENIGLSDIVRLHDGVFGVDKEKVLNKAAVFLMPSRFEGHPTGLLEALAYGLPSLVTTGSNMRKEIEEADAGWGADNTAESVSKALVKMINELGQIPQKSENAYELAKRYSWDAIAKKSHEEYLKLIEDRNI